MAELLTWLAKQLVDDPDAVRVEQVEREDATVLELYVAPDDRGKVIGRQGRLARALRTIVRASAAGSRKRVILDIVECARDGWPRGPAARGRRLLLRRGRE